jgi:broad specificity phosphatase PhoE
LATIYFIRHGQTDWNAEGRLQGGRDTDLNALGEAQAVAAADRLAALAG